jgi:DNA-binding NarL/FixJ family response regulator
MAKQDRGSSEPLRVLVADDSPDAIAQMSVWIVERWPSAEVCTASTPEDALRIAEEQRLENLILDLDFGSLRDSGVVIARKLLEARKEGRLRTRILFRTVHAGDPGYLHQIQGFLAGEERQFPIVWGFLDKGAVPKRIVQNAVEQVFFYEISFTEIFNQQLKNSPSRELSDLEFTVLIYACVGVTNDGMGWLIGASRQSVERIFGALYRKLKIPSRRGAQQGVPTLLESRTRLCSEAMMKGLVNPHLLREEDDGLRRLVNERGAPPYRIHISADWLDPEG